MSSRSKPNYGIDAPGVIRNFFVIGGICLLLAIFGPHDFRIGSVDFHLGHTLFWPAGFLVGEGILMLLYSLRGKFAHRDRMLALHSWRGDEQVLDVGTGRGLLLIAAAKQLAALNGSGHATGLDVWNKEDLSDNSEAGTRHNMDLEGVASRCMLVSEGAQQMSFPDATFDVVLSNLCLHNIYERTTRNRALAEIARVLKPGGTAILSDYKLTAEYAEQLRLAGLEVKLRKGNWLTTFPPLTIVIASKPLS